QTADEAQRTVAILVASLRPQETVLATVSARRIRRRGSCIFCGHPGVSAEHIWPDWASAYLPPSADGFRSYFAERADRYRELTTARIGQRRGNLWTMKLRRVCERCNNGWMSVLETQAKPILVQLMRSETCVLQQMIVGHSGSGFR